MDIYEITSSLNGNTLYSGRFRHMRACVEQAVADGVSLRHADFSYANLLNAQLDGGDFRDAVFTGCNLSGVNASECRMERACFTGATFYGTVLCNSSLDHAVFKDASFGGTAIWNASMKQCVFSTLSAFTLDFIESAGLEGSYFLNPCGTICAMSRVPLVVRGLQQDLIFLDKHIKIGHDIMDISPHGQLAVPTSINPAAIRLRLEQLAAFRRMQCPDNLTFHKKHS